MYLRPPPEKGINALFLPCLLSCPCFRRKRRHMRQKAPLPSSSRSVGFIVGLRPPLLASPASGAFFAAVPAWPSPPQNKGLFAPPCLPPPLAAPPCPPASPLPLAPARWSARCARSKRGGSPGWGPSGRLAPHDRLRALLRAPHSQPGPDSMRRLMRAACGPQLAPRPCGPPPSRGGSASGDVKA